MTPAYQGRALLRQAPRRPPGRIGRIVKALGVLAVIAALAHVPWGSIRRHVLTVSDIRVRGLHYLDDSTVVRQSGLQRGTDWLAADLPRARQALLADSRIREAQVKRVLPSAIELDITERVPVLLARHGSPWELDGEGVLLEPLGAGVVADVPMLTGVDVERYRAGTCVATAEVKRGLAWVRATAVPELELAGRISEIDVSKGDETGLVLMSGTRVVSSAWPPDVRRLSALRVVLADLEHRGRAAQEVDLRFKNQVIVRPAVDAPSGDAASRSS